MNTKQERRESPAGYHYYTSYRDCPRKFLLSYLWGLRPSTTSGPLVKGGAMHEAFAAYWTAPVEDASASCLETFQSEMRSRMEEYDQYEKFDKDLQSGLVMLRKWIDTWGQYDREHYDILGVEETFEVPFGPPGHEMNFTVRLDRIYRDKQTRNVHVVESKTTGWSVIRMFENTTRGDQITAQIWALSKMRPEWRCNSAIVDVLYNRGRVVQCERPGPNVYRSQEALRIFEMGMYSTIVEITQKVKALQAGTPWPLLFPPHKNYCQLFGCEFQGLCDTNVQPGETPPGYKRDPWVSERALEQLRERQDWSLEDWQLGKKES